MCENEHTPCKHMHLSLFYNKDNKKGRRCCTKKALILATTILHKTVGLTQFSALTDLWMKKLQNKQYFLFEIYSWPCIWYFELCFKTISPSALNSRKLKCFLDTICSCRPLYGHLTSITVSSDTKLSGEASK